jgi:hypothetical protein
MDRGILAILQRTENRGQRNLNAEGGMWNAEK